MSKNIPDHIYMKEDIDKAYDMGVDMAVSLFEKTIGMSQEKQRIILNRIKDMLLEKKAEVAMSNSYMKV